VFDSGLGIDDGHGLLCDNCDVVRIVDSSFTNLTGYAGGALKVTAEKLLIANSTFSQNYGVFGGALFLLSPSEALIINSTFKGNQAG
jgi:hypothetical protein